MTSEQVIVKDSWDELQSLGEEFDPVCQYIVWNSKWCCYKCKNCHSLDKGPSQTIVRSKQETVSYPQNIDKTDRSQCISSTEVCIPCKVNVDWGEGGIMHNFVAFITIR